jgi:hypothetical protein
LSGNERCKLRFYHDPDTDLPHIYEHNVAEDEVRDVLLISFEDAKGSHGSRVAVGQTRAGRCLKVVYVPDRIGDGIFVIAAYDLRGKPLAAFRRRMRKRRR